MTAQRMVSSRQFRIAASAVLMAASLLWQATPVYAQLDPTLFLKRSAPNIIVMLDTGADMQRDAPSDPSCVPGAANAADCDLAKANSTSSYYDPYIYTKLGAGNANWEDNIGVNAGTVTTNYRRKYVGLAPSAGVNAFTTTTIGTVGDMSAGYNSFEAPTRLSIARAAIYRAIVQNQNVARFGLYKMRQSGPTVATLGNITPILNNDGAQQNQTDTGANSQWNLSMPTVGGVNNGGSYTACANCGPADANSAANILAQLGKDTRTAGALLPAGKDVISSAGSWAFNRDRPVKSMLDDIMTVATVLNVTDLLQQQCRNTIAILVTGGGEGSTTGQDPVARALTFLTTLLGRRVPIYVVAIAPPASERQQLADVATKSGGQYIEITKNQIDLAIASSLWTQAAAGGPANTIVVPEAVKALNVAIQGGFQNFNDINTGVLFAWPPVQQPAIIPLSEFQVTTPIIGTVNLKDGKDINGVTLTPDPATVKDRAGNVLPQRSNVLLTAAFTLPGFDGKIRAYRVYKPVADNTQPTGWKFQSDGTPLWAACAPGTTTTGPCSSLATTDRNLYTTTADGTMLAFTVANAATLAPLMGLSGATAVQDATDIVNIVRGQPLGTILDSTPAIMNPPSLDPPPDDTYPAFAVAEKDRRTIIWVGTNRGIFEGIDARLGVEVWGYIPMNLLPKLRTLWDGQAIGSTDFMMDGSPKISDIRQADGTWKTYMFLSQGAGGTFYQTFDVTMANMVASVTPTDDVISHVLTYFSDPTKITMKWSYPALADWEPNCANVATLGANLCATSPYGDLKVTATATEKTVGQTWSDPAIGQVQGPASPYVMLAGSGFFPYSLQQQANRGGIVAGTTFYMFNAETGALLDSKSVGSDGQYEQQDNCSGTNTAPTPNLDCRQFKNALHSDPVATGPADSRFITKSYIGDLDGRLWRFDIGLDGSNVPKFNAGSNPTKLYDDPLKQPVFASMATVNVGGTQQYIFMGTGGDLLPSNAVSQQYRLLGILDNGATGTKTFEYDLIKVDNTAGDEKVTTFPAVAGDIVFFTTTTFNPASPCTLPTASLYALTFIGGAAYDTNNDGKFDNKDSVLVKSVAGVRGTAPFIVDQHLAFGAGGKVQLFGDSADYNNGIGQAGIRILSWREVR